jgi:hypothetical protein
MKDSSVTPQSGDRVFCTAKGVYDEDDCAVTFDHASDFGAPFGTIVLCRKYIRTEAYSARNVSPAGRHLEETC